MAEQLLDEIIEHARAEAPNECVGIITTRDGIARRVITATNAAASPLRYELEVAYPDGNTFTLRDPYAFTPTLGELDVHLASEGRHEELYEKLGAHVRTLDGV